MEVLYCNQQIKIPANLPHVLKRYTKCAIRTEPSDLLLWSVGYFRCLAKGEIAPVKDRMENVTTCQTATEGLTVGLLKVLHKQLGNKTTVSMNEVKDKWKGICMQENQIDELYEEAHWDPTQQIEWKQILLLLCGLVGKNMNDKMKVICQVLSKELPGCEPYLKWEEFWEAYMFMVEYDGGIKTATAEEVKEYLTPIASANDNQVGPRDFLNRRCPLLY